MTRTTLFRPDWKHRELVLRIGHGDYRFRTLSLYDVWAIWPHLVPIREAIERGKPMEFARRFSEILDHICPGLTRGKDFESWGQFHLDALIEFYEAQDWARIQALAEDLGKAPEEVRKPPEDGLNNESRFFMICMAAAKASNMAVPDFVEQRFEYCADAFMGLYSTMRAEAALQDKNAADFFMAAAAHVPIEQLSPDDERPEWLTEIERQTGKGPRVQ